MSTITNIETTEVFRGTGKRERILRAAVEVFAANGYFNSKVSEIAKAAGVADGTIYLYFDSKDDILITIFRELTRQYLVDLESHLAGSTDPREQIRKAIEFHLHALGSDRSLAVVFQVELRQSLKFMTLFSQQEVSDYLNILRRIVEDGQRRGVFRTSLHPQFVAKSVFGILDEMVTSWILSEKDHRPTDHAAEVAEFVLRGIG